MSTYVISDIHGCFDEFIQLLELINFSPDDKLILAGDYTDRGSQNLEVLRWLENCPGNVIPIKGNHDVALIDYIKRLEQKGEKSGVVLDRLDNEQLRTWFHHCSESLNDEGIYNFDRYGTLERLVDKKGVSGADLKRWAEMLDAMPYLYETEINGRRCLVVHAGYIEDINNVELSKPYKSLEYFYVWARNDAYNCGGINHGMIIAGHNPTNEPSLMTYAAGKVFRHYSERKDCIFYDVDCGGVYREEESRFACIRLEDEQIFYVMPS